MSTYDYDLHGNFRLRLENATSKEAQMVQRQVGPLAAPVAGEPDLTVQFVESIPEPPNLRYIGLNDAAYSDQAFYVLKGKNKTRVKVQIPFDKIGQQATICCERGLTSIPLLIPIINLSLLAKGILAFHASAFTFRGQGALITGWAKGGKTETLLAFMSQGARYVGDEWIYLRADENEMFGIPEPMRVWNWHLNSLPHYRARLKRKDQLRLTSLDALSRSMGWLAGSNGQRRGTPARLAQRVQPVINRQMFAHFAPHALFGPDNIQAASRIDKLFFAVSHNAPEVSVAPIDAEEVVQRMLFSLTEEQAVLTSFYQKYRFAFPQKCNSWIDNLERIQSKLLLRALNDIPAYAVYHPYPVHIPRLFEAMQVLFEELR
jgi:hypothetical protein